MSYNAVILLTDRECVNDELIAVRRYQWPAQFSLAPHLIPQRWKSLSRKDRWNFFSQSVPSATQNISREYRKM